MHADSIDASRVPARTLKPTITETKKMRMILQRAPCCTALSLLMPCVLLGLLAGCKTNPPTSAELQGLQGTWEGVMAGQESADKIGMTITGNSLHFQWLNTTSWYEATFTLPAGTSPRQLRATITGYQPTNDVGTNNIGALVGAIFKIEDGTLTLGASGDGAAEPPKTFASASCYLLKKVQRKNAEPPQSK